jgi:hypothetical protein
MIIRVNGTVVETSRLSRNAAAELVVPLPGDEGRTGPTRIAFVAAAADDPSQTPADARARRSAKPGLPPQAVEVEWLRIDGRVDIPVDVAGRP